MITVRAIARRPATTFGAGTLIDGARKGSREAQRANRRLNSRMLRRRLVRTFTPFGSQIKRLIWCCDGMGQYVRIVDDAQSAAVLAGSAGVLGAASVPLLLPSAFEFVTIAGTGIWARLGQCATG